MKHMHNTKGTGTELISVSIITLLFGIVTLILSLIVYLAWNGLTVSPDGPSVSSYAYKNAIWLLRVYAFVFTPVLAVGFIWAAFLSWRVYLRCKSEKDTPVGTSWETSDSRERRRCFPATL